MKLKLPKIKNVARGDAPKGRLTEMADAMVTVFQDDPRHQKGDRCIVLVDDPRNGGIALVGYGEDAEIITALLTHLRVFLNTTGKDIRVDVDPATGLKLND